MAEPAETPHATDRPAMTRAWIIAAFNRLVLGRRYESVSVGEVTRRAGVGRSTFYEHFRDKDDVLRQALAVVLTPLADAAVGRGDPCRVHAVLNHIGENRDRTLAMLDGPARAQIEQALADLVLARLSPDAAVPADATQRLESRRLAGSHLAVLRAWLDEPDRHTLAASVTAMLAHPAGATALRRSNAS
jgi:AcrR family transcriptional regulator